MVKDCSANSRSAQLYRQHSNIMENKGSPLISKISDKTAGSKRARVTLECDQNQPEVFPSTSRANFDLSSEHQSNNASLLHRVTNSVSGLFSNISWSEWLKGSNDSPSTAVNSDSSFNNIDISSESSRINNRFLNQLYPEEGNAILNTSEMPGISKSQDSGDKAVPVKFNIPSFKDEQSFMSSTPALSPYPKKRRVNEEYLRDSIISKPSTSDFHGDLLPPQDSCINLLKKSFPEAVSDNYNGSVNTLVSGRKRLRETMEEDETSDTSYMNTSKKRPLLSQMFSDEENETPSQIQRKRPRFSISTYGSPFYGKRTEEEEPSYSIFYPGKIMYGGASNHQRKRTMIIPRKICARTPATNSTSVDDHSDGGLSSAARRILECIDKISTPLSDSKRAFQFNNSRDYSLNSTTYVADFHKHRPSLKTASETHAPPAAKLLTPSKVKLTKNFSSLFEAKTKDVSRKKEENASNTSIGRKEQDTDESISDNHTKESNIASVFSRQKEMKTVNSNKHQELNGNGRLNETNSSNFGSFTSSIFGNATSKVWPTSDKTNSTNFISGEKLTATTDHRNLSSHTMADPSADRLQPSASENSDNIFCSISKSNTSSNSESKSLTEIQFNYQGLDSYKSIQYSFSKPGVVSDFGEETVQECSMEFKFSQPINESISTLKNDIQPLALSFQQETGSWECDTCLLRNKCASEKCIACQASKPVKTSQSKLVGQVDPFRKETGAWDCNTCLLRNKIENEKCIACSAVRTDSTTVKPVNEGAGGSWGDCFKPSKGSWECEMCLLQNKESVSNCAACETPKPGSTGPKKSVINTFGTKTSKWPDTFDLVQDAWRCPTCEVENTSKSSACVCCKTPKVKQSKGDDCSKNMSINSTFNSSSMEVPLKDSQKEILKKDNEIDWLCLTCITTNKSSDLNCTSCKCPKPTANAPSKNSLPSSFSGFGAEFFKSKNEWECETCLVRNKSGTLKCVSCASPKSGTDQSNIVSEAVTGNFKFGVNTENSKKEIPSKFNFRVPSVPQEKAAASFKFGIPAKPVSDSDTTTTFKFGATTESTRMETPVSLKPGTDLKPAEANASKISSTKLSLALEKTDSTVSQNSSDEKASPMSATPTPINGTPLSLTGSSAAATSTPASKAPTIPSFSFTSPANSESSNKEKTEISSDSKSSVLQFGTTSSNTPKLEFPKINSKDNSLSQLPKVNPSTFSFFGNNATASSPPQLSFGGTQETKASESTPNLFVFGQKEAKSSNTSFNFGNADANKPSTGSFNFGNTNAKPSTGFSFGGVDKPSFQFGNTNTSQSNPPNAGLFNFGSGASSGPAPAPTSMPVFNFGQPAASTFNAPSIKPAESTAPLQFGIPDSNPFNALKSISSSEPSKRVIKKGYRRLKQ